MEWIDINIEKPQVSGKKYLVKTLTTRKHVNKVEALLTITKDETTGKETHSFNVTNQIVTHWLKEDADKFIVLSADDVEKRIKLIEEQMAINFGSEMYEYSLNKLHSLLIEIKTTQLKESK